MPSEIGCGLSSLGGLYGGEREVLPGSLETLCLGNLLPASLPVRVNDSLRRVDWSFLTVPQLLSAAVHLPTWTGPRLNSW